MSVVFGVGNCIKMLSDYIVRVDKVVSGAHENLKNTCEIFRL